MSTLEPEDGAAPANSSAGGTQAADEGASQPGGQAPKKHRNPWIWVSVGLAVVVVGLLIWALSTRSDLDSANQDNEELQSQLEKGKETSSDALEDAKAAYDDVTKDLGATSEDLAAAEQDVDQAEKAAEKAEAEAAPRAPERVGEHVRDVCGNVRAGRERRPPVSRAARGQLRWLPELPGVGPVLADEVRSRQPPVGQAAEERLDVLTDEIDAALAATPRDGGDVGADECQLLAAELRDRQFRRRATR
jgi:uncharacterized membrane-anchored protein YhcB (DUF1043 family)